MKKRMLCLLLAVALCMTLFSACGGDSSSENNSGSKAESSEAGASESGEGSSEASAGETGNGVDLSKKSHLIMWSPGTPSRDHNRIVEKLSALTERDLNASLEWNRFQDTAKLNLLLTSGEPIDLIYTANYQNYAVYAAKDAFRPLDEFLPEISPALDQYVTGEMWDAARVNGTIYMVPCMWPEWVPYGFLWREDLRKKYNLPEITDDISTIEAYMEGIKQNEPDMQVTGEVVSTYGSIGSHFTTWEFLDRKYKWADFRVPYGLYIDYQDPTKVIDWWETEEFASDMKMFKSWADAGYWSRSSLANTENKQDAFEAGKTACDLAFNSPSGYANLVSRVAASHPDWELGWQPHYRVKNLATPNHATQNGMSIPNSANEPERGLLLLEKLVLDEEYFRLSQYGEEGVDYNVTEDGYYEAVGDSTTAGFPREAGSLWSTRNTEFMLYPEATAQILNELNSEFETYTYPNIWTGFAEDTTPYQSEKAALANVITEYLPPIQAGLVDDVDAAIAEFLEKAKVAGLDKIREEYKRQWLAYVEEHNIQPTTVK
ncbi:ABC transporter substrate-binding protein [Acutalibacter sp.]|jgi:putative aldouronate transport system substrate-binding protein|uniref:ABC transporter substrate-binding protein n=1 Tax=Acutalibacter sp. TaxID=1918636 RepID=UPI00216DB76F|nr:ABC transporter substrate-binding protein [Acutalibacter sp.]